MKLELFDFSLPESLIAQHPLQERDNSRLMIVRRASGEIEHRMFRDLPEILGPQDFVVLNSSKVIPARLRAHRPGRDERIEVLLLREETPNTWIALVRPASKALPGNILQAGEVSIRVRDTRDERRLLAFPKELNLLEFLEKEGEPPLPPYIRRRAGEDLTVDRDRYQTVFADQPGSVAAPTAGLHFTREVLHRLARRKVSVCELLLHVGYATFKPVRCQEIEDHRMEPEYFEVSDETAGVIRANLEAGRRMIAVGTTTARTVEHLSLGGQFPACGVSGHTDLFIYPGFRFHALGGLLTNFHLPKSTLFMLVCAFAGRENMLESYRRAVAEKYRFFSYGDCMLII